jgi:outer membrane protein W
MKTLRYIVLFAAFGVAVKTQAQVSTFGLNYNISIPTGNSADFIGEASFRGASFEYTFVPDDNFGVHFEGGWNNFYEKVDKATYERGTLSLTGTQYRYIESVPLFVGLNYFALPDAVIKPYAALGLGLIYTEQRNDVGMYSLISNGWQFGLKPELGAAVSLSESTFLKLSAKYYYGFKTDNLDAQSFIAFNMGLAFKVE